MRTLRLSVCLLVSGTLFILGGCNNAAVKSEVPVNLSNCAATPNTVTVPENGQVRWNSGDQHDYTIRFSDRNEPTANPVKVNHGVSNPAHPIKGHSGCDPLLHGEFYCEYSLTKDNETTPCKDPGLHVIP
jgi:hypothetical protein